MDDDIIQLLDILPTTVSDVLETLGKLQPLLERPPRGTADGIASFNYLYQEITREVLERLDAGDGFFPEPDFVRVLDVEFAARYLRAILDDAQNQPAARAWQVLFDKRADPDISPIQFAVAGVNAHVDYDLAFAVVSTCQARKTGLGTSQRRSYDAINTIFATHMRDLRHHFENRVELDIDAGAVADIADGIGDLSVVLARDAAWHRAEHLARLTEGTERYLQEADAIDWRASKIGLGILTVS